MLLTKTVQMSWNPRNKYYYENLGFLYTKFGDKFNVSVELLNPNSSYEVDVLCDYCLEKGIKNIVPKKYHNYVAENNKYDIKKDACKSCIQLKKKDITLGKYHESILARDDVRFWTFKENRLGELDKYIKEHKVINNMKKDKIGLSILRAFATYKDSMEEAIQYLGYDLDEVKIPTKTDIYNSVDKIISKIDSFINLYNRFPTIKETSKDLEIPIYVLNKFGGLFEIKKVMNYNDKDDLIDDNGWYNKSSYEYIVAQFLIHNNVTYKREQYPFPKEEGRHRSDFTFYLNSKDIIHCEVWGYDENNTGRINSVYTETKSIKKLLYIKHNIKLIELNNTIFLNKYQDIYNILCNAFREIITSGCEEFDLQVLIPPNKLNETDLFNTVMQYSDDSNYIPSTLMFEDNNKTGLYYEIIKRYGSLGNFAKKFNKTPHKYNSNVFEQGDVFNIFSNMIKKYKKVLTFEECKKYGYGDLRKLVNKNGGYINNKLEFYKYSISNKLEIPNVEIQWINDLINKNIKWISNKITDDQVKIAKSIIDNLGLIKEGINSI